VAKCRAILSDELKKTQTIYKEAVQVVRALLVVIWPDHDQQRSNRHSPTTKPEAPGAA
jgi:hypothetical protein